MTLNNVSCCKRCLIIGIGRTEVATVVKPADAVVEVSSLVRMSDVLRGLRWKPVTGLGRHWTVKRLPKRRKMIGMKERIVKYCS